MQFHYERRVGTGGGGRGVKADALTACQPVKNKNRCASERRKTETDGGLEHCRRRGFKERVTMGLGFSAFRFGHSGNEPTWRDFVFPGPSQYNHYQFSTRLFLSK